MFNNTDYKQLQNFKCKYSMRVLYILSHYPSQAHSHTLKAASYTEKNNATVVDIYLIIFSYRVGHKTVVLK